MTINPDSTNFAADADDDDEDYVATMEEVRATGLGFAGEDMGPSLGDIERALLKRAQRRSLMKR